MVALTFMELLRRRTIAVCVSVCRKGGLGLKLNKKMEAVSFAACGGLKPLHNLSGAEKPIIVINCRAVRGNWAF